jgi:aspartate carbamoyltransferase regulatory subunit
MKEKTKTSPTFALIEYFPSKSVCVVRVVPLTTTFAPGIGPVLSETTPVTVFSCANENCIDNASNSVKIHLNFDLILIFFELVILQTS